MTSTGDGELLVRSFRGEDQALVRALVLDGLADRWGELYDGLNRDLDDIGASYRAGLTLTAWEGSLLVGTGTLVPRSADEAEVLRMSTARRARGRGIATRLLQALIDEARRRGLRTVVLETAAHWSDARSLYERHGFVLDREEEGELCRDAFYRLDLLAPERLPSPRP